MADKLNKSKFIVKVKIHKPIYPNYVYINLNTKKLWRTKGGGSARDTRFIKKLK